MFILENFPCIVMQLENNHWALWSKEKNLLEIKLKYTEKKKEQIHMFDLVECAYYLDNTEALDFSISSIKSLELLLKYRVNIIEPYNINVNNNNNNNNTTAASSSSFSLNNSINYTTEALAFSLKNSYRNNNKTTTPEPSTYILKNNSINNLNSISEYSNLNNNSTSLARSASCSRQLNLIKEELKSSPIYILLHSKTLNIGNIQEALDRFNSNRADYPKITDEE
ncbi:hypothetical protein DICPUDRAFT_83915 [Dictyostelium purpureum]|uniref:Uncharacterized protein n=1 Tax=Dictyostelium purpureum TaxID=5786 RepID=F1A114_DICPU|nr:uncharacterized protein DICPUDRAFT_83915 [Dictyostelium purpureum]EGC30126.1 hypothetical protein DICPUDRAFT_83915 [Dictyostelium purpureum]|eukprot:XP_003293358.1 hypothetical protein DICPUDRAFT_83915 [Dictyostelium purpureum]